MKAQANDKIKRQASVKPTTANMDSRRKQ